MDIYRIFTRQTDFVVQYLSVARSYEHHTRVEVPKLKHAPVNLGRQLEDYLKDPDFEIHRRQYLAELEAKKKGGSAGASKSSRNETASKSDTAKAFSSTNGSQNGSQPSAKPAIPIKAPEADLIDFFESIEQNQTPMAVQSPPAQSQQTQPQVQLGMSPWGPAPIQAQPTQQFATNGFVAQPTGFAANSPFQQQPQQALGAFSPQQTAPQVQTGFAGTSGFGGFSNQTTGFQPSSLAPIPQDSVATFPTGAPAGQQGLQPAQQITNPFRQSMLMNQQTGSPFATSTQPQQHQRPQTSQSTNPFARSSPQAAQPFAAPITNNSPFQSQPPQQPQQTLASPIQAMPTGTNPFARNFSPPQAVQPQQQPQQQRPVTAGGALTSQPTGSTNPFRQGAFVNHNTGLGWQHNQQPIGGGLDQLETVPVFPRPAQQTPWQQ